MMTFDVEKYANALNNLIGMDSAYFEGDENVDAIIEVINIANRQQKQLDNYSHNVRNMSKDFIDQQKIIQEQQVEIEKLNVELVGMRGACNSYKMHYDNAKAEMESLKDDKIIAERHEKDARELYKDVVIQFKTAKSESIKEFAERLKCKKATFYCICGVENDYTDILNTHIDNLVKEMVGE